MKFYGGRIELAIAARGGRVKIDSGQNYDKLTIAFYPEITMALRFLGLSLDSSLRSMTLNITDMYGCVSGLSLSVGD